MLAYPGCPGKEATKCKHIYTFKQAQNILPSLASSMSFSSSQFTLREPVQKVHQCNKKCICALVLFKILALYQSFIYLLHLLTYLLNGSLVVSCLNIWGQMTQIWIPLQAVVFITTATVIYSLGYRLHTFIAMPRSTQPSTLVVKWISASRASHSNKWRCWMQTTATLLADSESKLVLFVWRLAVVTPCSVCIYQTT